MRVLDRLSLIDRVSRELQGRMSYGEIDTYLKAYGVDTKRPTSGVNSKWVYSKELLAEEPDSVVLRIADELGVAHNYTVAEPGRTIEATFWEPLHFRLFLSHLSAFKRSTSVLQSALRPYGISSFVAHVDIEPTREWQSEIEAGLLSMDALAAILMPGFKESNWCDQEVGMAVGRGVLVIPIIRGLNPYGFISKYQGLQGSGKTIAEVAREVFRILATSPRTRSRMLSCLVETTLQAGSPEAAHVKLGHLSPVEDLPAALLERLREGAASSASVSSPVPLGTLNKLLQKNGLKPAPAAEATAVVEDDDIPF